MDKKDKMYLIIFVLSFFSLLAAVVLKLCGVSWFDSTPPQESSRTALEYMLQSIILIVQGFIILGCMTWLDSRELIKKYIPIIPINILPLVLPSKYGLYISLAVFVLMAFYARPKLSTIPRFIIALIFIAVVQQASVWVKYDLLQFKTLEADAMTFLVGNIDQLILLALYYCAAMKWGDKIVELVLFRKNR